MRHMSFALTTEQVWNQTKTVTRRTAWVRLKPGTLLQPVVKGQGIKKGEKVQKIGGPIRVVSVKRKPLWSLTNRGDAFGREECRKEGFPEMTGRQFIAMFCRHNGTTARSRVTRIEFEYTEPRA